MNLFVTGASGWIGSAVVPELLAAGYQVTGLARSDASAEALTAAGVSVLRGDLTDPDRLGRAASDSDGVVHLAFRHDIAFAGGFQGATDADRLAIEAFGEALAGSDRPLLIASGLLGLVPDGVSTERDAVAPVPGAPTDGVHGRLANAHATLALARRGVRSIVLRLPPTVHGAGDNGFLPAVVATARATGVSAYVGEGSQRWPAVHRSDAARLVRLALESAPAGTVLHAVDDEGVPVRSIAEVLGRQLGLPVTSVPAEDAGRHFGFLGALLGMDSPSSSALTRRLLGWSPTGPDLLADLEAGTYTNAPAAGPDDLH